MDKLELVSADIVFRAYENFKVEFHLPGNAMGYYLWNFIGGVGSFNGAENSWKFQPLQAQRLRMLAGPHHKAIMKIMILQGLDPYTEMERND